MRFSGDHDVENFGHLQVAILRHFQTQEFSYLLAEPSDSLACEVTSLSKAARQRLMQLLDLPARSTAAGEALQRSEAREADWKLAVKLTKAIAIDLGHRAGRTLLTLFAVQEMRPGGVSEQNLEWSTCFGYPILGSTCLPQEEQMVCSSSSSKWQVFRS